MGSRRRPLCGAPVPDERPADQSVNAALEMQSRLEAWNATRRAEGKVELHHGIGIHSGTVVAGNIGSAARMSYSLVGDVVNVASRIQSLNKEVGTRILVSAVTCARLITKPEMRALPAVRVRGRALEVEIFALG